MVARLVQQLLVPLPARGACLAILKKSTVSVELAPHPKDRRANMILGTMSLCSLHCPGCSCLDVKLFSNLGVRSPKLNLILWFSLYLYVVSHMSRHTHPIAPNQKEHNWGWHIHRAINKDQQPLALSLGLVLDAVELATNGRHCVSKRTIGLTQRSHM